MSGKTPTDASLPPAILLGGTTNALSVARSLGRRGITVVALHQENSPVRHSRFARSVEPRAGGSEPAGWLEWLMGDGVRSYGGGVVLPCSDDGLELVARHRAELGPHYILTESDDAVTMAMLDKARTYALARQHGIPAPRVWAVRDRDDLAACAAQVPYPCALKPRHSHRFQRHFGSLKLFVARDRQELLERYAAMERLGLEMLASEIVPGADDQLFSYFTYIDEAGEPLLDFTKHKLRQYPIHYGIGTYHVSDESPEVAELGLRFFRRIGLRGMAYVEFKRDARDGRLKLIECNPRFSAANELLARSGIDFSLLVYNRLTGRPLPPCTSYRTGVRLVRPLEDVAAFVEYRRRGEITLWEWAGTLCRGVHTVGFSWSDPAPSVVQAAAQLLYQVRKRLWTPLARCLGGRRERVRAKI